MMQLLESRKDQYIIMDTESGEISTLPKSTYYKVKIEGFNGNRIMYKMDADHEITETFDNGVFNCRIGPAIMQLDNRDEIAGAILEHKASGALAAYDELFRAAFSEKNRVYLLKHVLGLYANRLKITAKHIEIDGMFRVDNNAAAYVRDASHASGFNYLCIVVKPGALGALTQIKTDLGTFEIDIKGLEIIAKVLFLLNPNPDDRVFMQQLSSAVKDHVWQIAGKTDLTLW